MQLRAQYPPHPGSYPPMYPNNPPYFAQPNCYAYPYQDVRNFGPVDNRFSQNSENRMQNVQQPPGGLPVPPMNMPIPFPPYNGPFPFAPPMPPYPNFNALPPSGDAVNCFSNPPPRCGPPAKSNRVNGERFQPYQKSREFQHEKRKPFHCGSCDKHFFNEDKYKEHVAEHVICGLEGCTFKAHPSIVEKHISMQHRNGLFNRIVKGNTPEEIEKWIMERKKHYPTGQKIIEKQTQRNEMEKRGERYSDRQKSFNNRNKNSGAVDRKNQQSSHRSKAFGKNTRKFSSHPNQTLKRGAPRALPKKKESSEVLGDDFEYQRNLPPFRGTAFYLSSGTSTDDYLHSDSDNEERSCSEAKIPKQTDNVVESSGISCSVGECPKDVGHSKSKPRQLLNSLEMIKGYDSSEDDNDCDEPSLTCSSSEQKISLLNEDDDSGPEECSSKLPLPDFILRDLGVSTAPINEEGERRLSKVTISKPDNPIEVDNSCGGNNTDNAKKRRRKQRNGKLDAEDRNGETEQSCQNDNKPKVSVLQHRKRFRPRTLLEKLLAPEIKHERNVILQCVRYVVNKNYFDIGSRVKNMNSSVLQSD